MSSAPTGRIRNPTPKVAVVSSNWPYADASGKNDGPMNSIRKLKTVKSKNSRALPMVVPAITRRRETCIFVSATGARTSEIAAMTFS